VKVEGGYPVDDELIAITPRYSGARFEGGRPPGPWEIRPFGPILGSLSRRSLMRFSSKWDPIAATVLGVLMVVALVFAPLWPW
jgi:hypothetical protein